MAEEIKPFWSRLRDQWATVGGGVAQGRRRIGAIIEERLRQSQIAWVPSLINPRRAFRFLWAGVVLIVLTCAVGVVAIQTSTGLLYLLLGFLLGLWIVSAVISAINLAGLSVRRDVNSTSQVGEKMIVTYIVTNHKRLLSSYSVVLEELGRLPMVLPSGFAMTIAPGQERRINVEVCCRRRGHMRLRWIRLSSRFPFGLAAKCVLFKEAADIVIHPSLGRIRADLFSARTSSASGAMGQYNQQTKGFEEYYGIREFHNFDNYHWIHWRSSAKTDQLLVKEMSEYHANQITILLDTRVEDPLSLDQQEMLEAAISFAATLIDRAIERSLPVALVVSGGDAKLVRHGRGAGHRWSLMTELAGVRMGRWGAQLPNLGSFRPRSFVDSHYWVIGVGVRRHLGHISSGGQSTTVIDTERERFKDLFSSQHVKIPQQGKGHSAKVSR